MFFSLYNKNPPRPTPSPHVSAETITKFGFDITLVFHLYFLECSHVGKIPLTTFIDELFVPQRPRDTKVKDHIEEDHMRMLLVWTGA